MAINQGSLIEIALRQTVLSGVALNTYTYQVTTMPGTVLPVDICAAWWSHVKATQRAMVASGFGAVLNSIKITELNNPEGDYAEYAIPLAEQTGTRSAPTQAEGLPPFIAAGVRLLVGSRLTKPGQKRFPFLVEQDSAGSMLQSAMLALVQAHAAVISAEMLLGAPAALTTLSPIVCRRDPQGVVLAHQLVTGYLVNPWVTTQNTRKMGRGI